MLCVDPTLEVARFVLGDGVVFNSGDFTFATIYKNKIGFKINVGNDRYNDSLDGMENT